MMKVTVVDFPRHGITLIPRDDPAFDSFANEILANPFPPGFGIDTVSPIAAVLLNGTGQAIVTLSYIWAYTTDAGRTFTNRTTTLGSSTQMDVLTGRSKVTQDPFSFILPGSKRLLTENGMIGNNLDVLPPDAAPRGGGFVGTGRGHGGRSRLLEDLMAAELAVDVAVLEDGLCIGPDTSGLVDHLSEEIKAQRELAQQVLDALEHGASTGEVFDMLRPLARRDPLPGRPSLMSMFVHACISQLTRLENRDLREWFQHAAQARALHLRSMNQA
jgi:hypothetical protein